MAHFKLVTEKERRDRVRLMRSARIGPIIYRQLMDRFGHASAAIAAIPELVRRGGSRRPMTLLAEGAADQELEHLAAMGAHLVTYGEPGYPHALMAIDDAPPGLSILGDPKLIARDTIAIVGARNASAPGLILAREMATELGRAGFVVASGLARGIDRAVHEGAIEGGTVAVMAGGVDIVYPHQNRDVYDKIRETGAVVSEMPLGTKPTARHFPPRNRIVSGLSLGVVVVEAAQRSGSLITARLAGEQGREVMCVPGSPRDPRSQGPNKLIRDGALLVRNGDDVVEALRPMIGGAAEQAGYYVEDETEQSEIFVDFDGPEITEARERVVQFLSPTGVMVDELLRECQMSPAIVHAVLLELELAGRLERQPGGRVARV